MPAAVIHVEYEPGSEVLSREDLVARFGEESVEKAYAGTGIRSRRIAAPGVCGSDMANTAAVRLLEKTAFDRSRVDLLLYCTQSPDYKLPSTACVLQERLGLKRSCAAFDINLGCSQYVYGLGVAHGMISSGLASNALLLTGDTMSRLVHPQDRAVASVLADAGTATLLTSVPDGVGFLGFEFGTDGSGYKELIVPAGGARKPSNEETAVETTDEHGNVRSLDNIYMNGLAIFHFAIGVVPDTVKSLLARLNLTLDEVDLFVFHQPNKLLLDYLYRKLKIGPERRHTFIEDIGNTNGSALPVALADAIHAGKVRPGMKIFLMAFGVGLSWAATVIRWPEASAA